MKFKYIEAQNFRSYSHLHLDLEHLGLTLISARNGSGKSSILYALIYALYGETPDGAKGDEIIKKEVGKDCYAKTEFTHFKHDYIITRYRKNKEYGNKVLVSRDNKDITLSTNKETDKLIVSILGFGMETMLNSLVFNPEKLNTFVSSTDKQRKQMLEELTNTNIYKQAQALVKIDRDTARDSLSKAEEKQQQLITLQDSQKTIQNQYQQNIALHESRLSTLTDQIQNLQGATKPDTTQLEVNQKELKRLNKEMASQSVPTNPYRESLIKGKNYLANNQNKVKELKDSLADLLTYLNKLKNAEINTCPWCGSPLDEEHRQTEIKTISEKMLEQGKEVKHLLKLNQEAESKIAKLTQQSEAKETEIKGYQDHLNELNSKLNALHQEINRLQMAQNTYEQNQTNLANLQHQLAQVKAEKIDKPEIIDYHADLTKVDHQIKKLNQQLDNCKDLIKVYSDQGVKAQALALVIPFLNEQLETILKGLTDDSLNAYLSAESKTKTGKVKEQISLHVDSVNSGANYQDLSSGEKRRIGIALNIAFMNYLKSQIGGINLVVFDEVFDNLDHEGIDAVVKYLSTLTDIDNVLIISHNTDLVFNDEINTHLGVKKIANNSELIYNK